MATQRPISARRLQDWLPKLVLAPRFAVDAALRLRLHPLHGRPVLHRLARCCPRSTWVGLRELREAVRPARTGTPRSPTSRSSPRSTSSSARVLGLMLAILLDQKIRGEGVLRPIYLYPMALSFIVTGTAWKWFLDPGIGLEQTSCTSGAGRASPSTGSRTATWRSTPSSSPPSGRPRASSWRCSSPACAASTTRS